MLFKYGYKKVHVINVKGKKHEQIKIKRKWTLNTIMRYIPHVLDEKFPNFINFMKQIDDNNEIIFLDDIKFLNVYSQEYVTKNPILSKGVYLYEYYNRGSWDDMVEFNNREVIDIGANIGDTPLIFARWGAKKVIGFEPVKEFYEIGLKNLDLNPKYKNNIQYINKAVGGKRGTLDIHFDSVKTYTDENNFYKIDVITVEDVLNEYNIKPDILKMDCEGCEFEIILNNDLSMFNDIIFEYHSFITGIRYQKLVDKLEEQGFKIKYDDKMTNDIGIIHAYK